MIGAQSRDLAEAEGLEPPTRLRALAFKVPRRPGPSRIGAGQEFQTRSNGSGESCGVDVTVVVSRKVPGVA